MISGTNHGNGNGNKEEMEKIGRGTYSDEGGITVVAAK